jgi:hypothetical protein
MIIKSGKGDSDVVIVKFDDEKKEIVLGVKELAKDIMRPYVESGVHVWGGFERLYDDRKVVPFPEDSEHDDKAYNLFKKAFLQFVFEYELEGKHGYILEE